MNMTIHFMDEAQPAVGEAIAAPLVAYNAQKIGAPDRRPLVLALRDEHGNVVGGLWGHTAFGWLYVEVLVVQEGLRARGIGTDLLSRAESEAIARGCHILLSTS